MPHFDIFNGDADGICALVQLRNAEPIDSTLITGVKRDIKLIARAGAGAGDTLTVLDISLDKNRAGLVAALEAGASVWYVDHHFAGEVPDHPELEAIIDTAPEVCTSLLVDRHLDHRFAAWAVTGAYGDNLDASAEALADRIGLDATQRDLARRLGTCINYNGYGSSLEDLHFPPAELFALVRPFATPFAFIEARAEAFAKLERGYGDDMAAAAAVEPTRESSSTAMYTLPDAPWARRVSGVFGNQLAKRTPARAHAVLTERANGSYLVSVRAPLERRTGADDLCRQFETGGGRKAAAGINELPASELPRFIEAFEAQYG